MNKKTLILDNEYKTLLQNIKQKLLKVQLKAAIAVNYELLRFYWDLGEDIVKKQSTTSWGDGLIKQLSRNLMNDFPDMKGFSERNIKYVRQWFLFYNRKNTIGQQLVAQLENEISQEFVATITQIPWGQNILKPSLPSIEELERELTELGGNNDE